MNRYFDIRPPQKKPSKNKQTTKRFSTKATRKGSRNSGSFLLILIIILTFVVYFSLTNTNINYSNDQKQEEEKANNVSTLINDTQVKSTPTSTTETTDDINTQEVKTNTKITILNGDNTDGLAQNIKELLENNNIEVEKIGNTKNPYSQTIIYFSENNYELANNLKEILNQYSPKLEQDDILTSDNEIIIVVTNEKNN